MTTDDTLLGTPTPTDEPAHVAVSYVEPERAFNLARQAVSTSLDQAQAQLKSLRAKRDEINTEIRQLVAEVDLLERMARIPRKAGG